MKRFYISSHAGVSGINKYSRDFYRLILQEKGYIQIDSSSKFSEIFSAIASKDYVHIELGIFQKKEIEILMRMIRANYRNITVTLHDAPLIKYPFHEFRFPLLNKFSKFYDIHWNNFAKLEPYVKKINRIYVLSRKGVATVKTTYHASNVHYLPHIVDTSEITTAKAINNNFIYFGFIGPNKGIEYSLKLHQRLLGEMPGGSDFYVVGKPLDGQKTFYDSLKSKYKQNVHYLGYVPDEDLKWIFQQATFALLPFRDYGFFYPSSGSILNSLKNGKVVFTNNVNTVPEIIEDGKNGFFLCGQLNRDAEIISKIAHNEVLINKVINTAHEYVIQNHSVEKVNQSFNE